MNADEFSQRLWEFAGGVAKVVERLPDTRLGRHVAGQLLRCGTSPAPNYDEACSAESRDDFVHKLGVAAKEVRETRGWLRFIVRMELQTSSEMETLVDEADQLLRMLSSSILSTKRRHDLGSPS